MSLKGEAKQLIYEITNDFNLSSCKVLRSKLPQLVDTYIQGEVISSLLPLVSAGQGRGKLLSEIVLLLSEITIYHSVHKWNPDVVDNIAAVFYACTTNTTINLLVRILAYSSLCEISIVVQKVDYYHMFSTAPSAPFLLKYHHMLLASGVSSDSQRMSLVSSIQTYSCLSPSLLRYCIMVLPPEVTLEIATLNTPHPHQIILSPSAYPREYVVTACRTALRLHRPGTELQRLAILLLLQLKENPVEFVRSEAPFQSMEITALKIILRSLHPEYEAGGELMASVHRFHRHFFHGTGGDFPAMFFRAVRHVYQGTTVRDVSKREIEQTVRIILFDHPQYSLYAVNFLIAIPPDSYDPELLEVLLQLVEFITNQSDDRFKDSADYYIQIFKRYLSLRDYSPSCVVTFCKKYCQRNTLSTDQLLAFVELIREGLKHPYLGAVCHELAELCSELCVYPVAQSYAMLLRQYLRNYCISKLRTALFGSHSYASQLSESSRICIYSGRSLLSLDRICTTISRSKYTVPDEPYTEMDMSLYLSELSLTLTLSYCVQLPRDEELYTCTDFHFTSTSSALYKPIPTVSVPLLRSGDTLDVALSLVEPGPTTLRCAVEFTQLQTHFRCVLPSLSVSVLDLLCKLPTFSFSPHLVFEELWEECMRRRGGGERGEGGERSLITILKPCDGIGFKLSSFRLPPITNSNHVRYMFGLPPSHFVLIVGQSEFPSVRVAMDTCRLLPLIHKLFMLGSDCE